MKRHDSGLLGSSGILQKLQQFTHSPVTVLLMCLYGNLAYPPRVYLQCSFGDVVLRQEHRDFNKLMFSECASEIGFLEM